jgi:hypothetical protein
LDNIPVLKPHNNTTCCNMLTVIGKKNVHVQLLNNWNTTQKLYRNNKSSYMTWTFDKLVWQKNLLSPLKWKIDILPWKFEIGYRFFKTINQNIISRYQEALMVGWEIILHQTTKRKDWHWPFKLQPSYALHVILATKTSCLSLYVYEAIGSSNASCAMHLQQATKGTTCYRSTLSRSRYQEDSTLG